VPSKKGGSIDAVVTSLASPLTHIWFHPDGAVFDLPIYDRDEVLAKKEAHHTLRTWMIARSPKRAGRPFGRASGM
jgi:hypothetical protein